MFPVLIARIGHGLTSRMTACTSQTGTPVTAMKVLTRGFRRKCPCCGEGRLFDGYLKVTPQCTACGDQLGHIRADDFPPYLTMAIVGHIVVPLVLILERLYAPSITMHLAILLPLTAILTYFFLPRVKGAIVGWMMHLGIRGDETQ